MVKTKAWKAELPMLREVASISAFREARQILLDSARTSGVDVGSFGFTVTEHDDPKLLVARAHGHEGTESALRHAFIADVWSGQ